MKSSLKVILSTEDHRKLVSFVALLIQIDKRVNGNKKTAKKCPTLKTKDGSRKASHLLFISKFHEQYECAIKMLISLS